MRSRRHQHPKTTHAPHRRHLSGGTHSSAVLEHRPVIPCICATRPSETCLDRPWPGRPVCLEAYALHVKCSQPGISACSRHTIGGDWEQHSRHPHTIHSGICGCWLEGFARGLPNLPLQATALKGAASRLRDSFCCFAWASQPHCFLAARQPLVYVPCHTQVLPQGNSSFRLIYIASLKCPVIQEDGCGRRHPRLG